jgi:hypothetical protein
VLSSLIRLPVVTRNSSLHCEDSGCLVGSPETRENLRSKISKFSACLGACLFYIFLVVKYRSFLFDLVHIAAPITAVTAIFHGAYIKSDTDHVFRVPVTGTWNSAVNKPKMVMLSSTTAMNNWPSETRNVSVSI